MGTLRKKETNAEKRRRLLKEYIERRKLPETQVNWVYKGSRTYIELENGLLLPVAVL